MKISTNWLKDYVNPGWTPEELGDRLTMSGLELEEIIPYGSSLQGVVVGDVQRVQQHPNADRLTVCHVDLGNGEPVQIVCGAPNVATGQRVAVAPVGTTLMLPDRKNPDEKVAVTMKAAKIRGEVSRGMICAEDELGLSDDHSGIMVLGADARPGESLAGYLERQNRTVRDQVLDVAITPNRPDAISHLGVARDVAALSGSPVERPDVHVPEPGGEAEDSFNVDIEATDGCHRYVGILVRGVTIQDSPDWLQRRLEAVGLRPRNVIVDITNYVMFECGQPLHAFDFNQLDGRRIIVRRTPEKQSFTTLDSKERTLPKGTLMIADGARDVAIAGVMGGENSEVTEATTDVLIESAYFEPSGIRRTAKALGLQTDASYRFERGIDPEGQAWAAARAAEMMRELAGGTIVPGMVDAHPVKAEVRTTTLRRSRLALVMGESIPDDMVVRLLTAIGFAVEPGSEGWTVTIPAFRPDVEREIDVIEEVGRLYGFDRIGEPTHSRIPNAPLSVPAAQPLRDRIAARLAGAGYRETFTNSMLARETAEQFGDPGVFGRDRFEGIVETLNPISQEMAALRPSILPGMLKVVGHNLNHGQTGVRFFEYGTVFERREQAGQPIPGYVERTHLVLACAGTYDAVQWDRAPRAVDIFDVKGMVESVVQELGLPAPAESVVYEPTPITARRITLAIGKQPFGAISVVRPDVAASFDITAPVIVAEIDFDRIVEHLAAKGTPQYRPIERYPQVERDLAVVVPEDMPAGPLRQTISRFGGKLLRSVEVFDVYRGDRIAEGSKSIAFSLRFGADRTLRDKEVDKAVKGIVRALKEGHGAELRD